MKHPRILTARLFVGLCLTSLVSCTSPSPELDNLGNGSAPELAHSSTKDIAADIASSESVDFSAEACNLVENGFGPQGSVDIRVEEVVTGLEVPWGIAFLPEGDMLVTERSGQVRLVREGKLQPSAVATIPAIAGGEGGLLGIAAHPDFTSNRLFYLYYTTRKNGSPVNRVERWQLSQDGLSASPDRVILDDIPVAIFHDGGRLRFGPDKMLYIGTGDARNPDSSQNVDSLAGKILRLTPDGQIPKDNPFPGNPAFILGIRNTQGFDWADDLTLWITDHGPSGELGRRGHDEVSMATAGDNLGWPTIYGCQSRQGMIRPSLTWEEAVPPGGAAIYTGNAIPEWRGSLIVGTLGSEHLHRVAFDSAGQLQRHEVYLQENWGRLREVVMGSDGELYVTTSNCDNRGSCPPEKDKILRITR